MSCAIAHAFVIGPGEVGRRLLHALDAAGVPAQALRRGDPPGAAADPSVAALRLVCVREEDLAGALALLGGVPRERLALVQNGFLEPVHGALGPVTRGLVWFTSKGPFFRELAPTLVHGPHAAFLADALSRGGLDVRVLGDDTAFRVEMIVKGLWNAVVGLPLAVHGLDLATYLATREDEWRALVDEGARAASAWYGVDVVGDDAARRVVATTADLGWVRGGAKALPWRNGALARMGRACGVATPVNDALLRAAGFDPENQSVTF